MHTLRLQLAPCTLSCQTPSETSCKRRAAALGGQRAGSLHRASTTWGQRETASCLRAAELGGSSFFFQESHTSSSSHPLLLQTFPYHGHPLLCLALAENHSSELHRGAGDTLQRVSISYCKALLCFVVLFFFFFPLSDTALQCCVSLSAPFISISRLRSAQLPALFSGHPTEPSCPSAPRDAAPHPSGRNNRGVVLACSQHLAPFLLGGPQLLPPPPRSPLGCGKPCQHQPLHCSAHFQH